MECSPSLRRKAPLGSDGRIVRIGGIGGLGWIRAEELAAAGRYYGLDALYFTRLSEAVEKWGRETE